MTPTDETQQTIGKYQVMAKVAEDARGAVYKAFDPDTRQSVAIKVAGSAVVRDAVMLQRFEQEYRSISSLSHPNIIRGLDFGWEGPRPYIVLEYFEGENLWSRLKRQGQIPEDEAVPFIAQVAEGLHEAHKNGIIHRDIKPENILLTSAGRAKLADLGLCKDLDEDADLTQPGHTLGTPNFIAPEQFGDAKNASIRCDIYSLGATLYTALTGQLPFAGPSLSAIMKFKMANDFVMPRTLVPSLSERTEWAVRRAIQADPSRRFATCPEFIAALSNEEPATSSDGKPPITTPNAGGKRQGGGQERRTARRFECALPASCAVNLSVHDEAAESQASWDAQAYSLSVNGIGFYLPRRFEPGSLLNIVLTSRSGKVTASRQMRVVRVTPTDGAGWLLAGALTEHLSKEELRNLL